MSMRTDTKKFGNYLKKGHLMEVAFEMFPDAIKKGAIFLVLSEVLGYLDWGIEEGTIELDNNQKYRGIN